MSAPQLSPQPSPQLAPGPQADLWSRVATVVVTHHSATVIGRCLAGVACAARMVVVENVSADGSFAYLLRILASMAIRRPRPEQSR